MERREQDGGGLEGDSTRESYLMAVFYVGGVTLRSGGGDQKWEHSGVRVIGAGMRELLGRTWSRAPPPSQPPPPADSPGPPNTWEGRAACLLIP